MNGSRLTPKQRVGLRDIASAAGVCLMTVSLSLRDSPRISPVTRDRVRQLARELGYQPDPEISRLMRHLRTSRTSQGKVGLAILDFYPAADFAENSYNARIRQGAVSRAAELGFSVTHLHLADAGFNVGRLLRIVRHRGLEGAVLLPSVAPIQLNAAEADWDPLSVVATSNSILSPRFHSVVPHQFANMMRLIESVHARGRRRMGAVFDEFFDERTGHNFTAAVNWHHHAQRTLVLPSALSLEEKARRVTAWIERYEPDVVFAQAANAVAAALPLLATPRGLPFEVIGLGAAVGDTHAHIDERPELVGSGAVDLLAGMIYYHETGVPEHPRTTMIDGEFHLASSPVLAACS